MDSDIKREVLAVIAAGQDLTLATVRADGAPETSTVSYASDGADIYFGCSSASRKAANLARDPRVALSIDLPYARWNEIRGLSLTGRVRPIASAEEMMRVGHLFTAKFGQAMSEYVSADLGELRLFRIEPEFVSLLDYRKGFGHTDLVRAEALAA